jgi:hypothetical protein
MKNTTLIITNAACLIGKGIATYRHGYYIVAVRSSTVTVSRARNDDSYEHEDVATLRPFTKTGEAIHLHENASLHIIANVLSDLVKKKSK